jgi:hypothetical protein
MEFIFVENTYENKKLQHEESSFSRYILSNPIQSDVILSTRSDFIV